MSKIISFIVPAYNVEKYIEQCLKSFLDTTLEEFMEVIIVNDGSTDHTQDIIEKYVGLNSNIFKAVYKKNAGHGSAINVGTKLANGKYLKIIDSDDWVITSNLAHFINVLFTASADVILTPYHMIDISTGDKTSWEMFCDKYEHNYNLSEILLRWKDFDRCLTFHGITYSKEFYMKYRHELTEKIFYEDHEYATIPCCYAETIMPVNIFIYQYMIGNSEQSISLSNQLKRLKHIELVALTLAEYDKCSNNLLPEGHEYIYKKTEGVLLSVYVTALLINPDKKNGRITCKAFNKKLYTINPQFLNNVMLKYRTLIMMSYFNMTYYQYKALLNSKTYNILRKNHKFNNSKGIIKK